MFGCGKRSAGPGRARDRRFFPEADMDVSELLDKTRENLGVQRVFGEVIRSGELMIIPVARLGGAAGGGGGTAPGERGSGMGAGYSLSARPAGAYVISGRRVRWRPALDVNRIILGGQLVAAVALLTAGRLLQARMRAAARGRRRRRGVLRRLGR